VITVKLVFKFRISNRADMSNEQSPSADEAAAADDRVSIYRTLVENSADMLVLASDQLERIYVSPSALQVTGYAPEQLVGSTPFAIIHPDDQAEVAAVLEGLSQDQPNASVMWRCIRPDGTQRWLATTYRLLPDGRLVAVVRDIHARKQAEIQLQDALARLEALAMVDPLTGIANRRAFLEGLERCLSCNAPGRQAAVLLVDLDDFKPINDLYGHAAGDTVLTTVAERLQNVWSSLQPNRDAHSWVVARLGGDEFAVLLDGATRELAEQAAHAIVWATMPPIVSGGLSMEISASVGVTVTACDGSDPKALLLRADIAMYEAKRQGGAGYCLFEAMPDSLDARRVIDALGVKAPSSRRRAVFGQQTN